VWLKKSVCRRVDDTEFKKWISPLPHTCHMPHPSHPPWVHQPSNSFQGVQIMNYDYIVQFSSATYNLLPYKLNIFLGTLFPITDFLCASLIATAQHYSTLQCFNIAVIEDCKDHIYWTGIISVQCRINCHFCLWMCPQILQTTVKLLTKWEFVLLNFTQT